MQRRGLKEIARLNLILVGVALVLFFGVGLTTDKPMGWGAAYVFGKPASVTSMSSCRTETIISGGSAGKSMGTCESATWTVDGNPAAGPCTRSPTRSMTPRTSCGSPARPRRWAAKSMAARRAG